MKKSTSLMVEVIYYVHLTPNEYAEYEKGKDPRTFKNCVSGDPRTLEEAEGDPWDILDHEQ
ncbi:MAG: hypothetical protein VXX73_05975 [Pseudomonadota bacterium]|nr:hypothetical protein [Pseudomonadota bacterium]